MLKAFVSIFEGAYALCKASARKTNYLKIEKRILEKAYSLSEQERNEKFNAEFDEKMFSIFDDLIRQGVPGREAIKQINATLKAEDHP